MRGILTRAFGRHGSHRNQDHNTHTNRVLFVRVVGATLVSRVAISTQRASAQYDESGVDHTLKLAKQIQTPSSSVMEATATSSGSTSTATRRPIFSCSPCSSCLRAAGGLLTGRPPTRGNRRTPLTPAMNSGRRARAAKGVPLTLLGRLPVLHVLHRRGSPQ